MDFSVFDRITTTEMIIALRLLTLCFYVLIEALIQYISSGILSARGRKIYYWTMFAVSRFAFVAIDSCFVFEIQDEAVPMLNLWRDYILPPGIFWAMFCTAKNTSDWLEKRRRERMDMNDCLNWMHPGMLYFNLRHYHLPLFDSIRFLYTLYRRLKQNAFLSYATTIIPLGMLDSYHNDPVWPQCSITHSIMAFVCDTCTKDDGFYWIRYSFIRQKNLVRYISQFPERYKRDMLHEILMDATYQNGLILITVWSRQSQDLCIYDVRNDRFSVEFAFKPPLGVHIIWCLLDDGEELGDQRNSSSTYFRVIYKSGHGMGHPFAYGQFLYEIYENKRRKKHPSQVVPYRWPWLFLSHHPFITSTGQVGIEAKLHDDTSPGEVVWKTCVVYDPKSFKLKVTPRMEDLMETDRPRRLFAHRYIEFNAKYVNNININNIDQYRPFNVILKEKEALVCRKDGSIWRTWFQPPSLKSICLEKVFVAYRKKLSEFSAKDWLQMMGVDMWPHFPSQKWKEF